MESLNFVNLLNFISSVLICISVIYGFIELEVNFIFTNLIALIYSCFSIIVLVIVSIAGFRGLHPPEILDPFENHYVQLLLIVFTNLLYMGTSFTGLIIGSILLFYTLCISTYLKFFHQNDEKNNEPSTSV